MRKDAAELNRSKIEVLEALLRLRQAACHPGLIDPSRAAEPSAKLDMLLPAARRGRRGRAQGPGLLPVHQLPGDRPRAARRRRRSPTNTSTAGPATAPSEVERFQTDPDCPIFLISLKAGGLGLNLTAAEYVYLLDPWWNPAVEAQAIDRSHRIGQTQHVFAYRLICRDTVEEKILELQQKKRDLADAILNADNRADPEPHPRRPRVPALLRSPPGSGHVGIHGVIPHANAPLRDIQKKRPLLLAEG